MVEDLKKEKLELSKLYAIAGGAAVGVTSDGDCRKPGQFKVLENKENEWKENGCPEKCKYCWHLKFKNGFFCDA